MNRTEIFEQLRREVQAIIDQHEVEYARDSVYQYSKKKDVDVTSTDVKEYSRCAILIYESALKNIDILEGMFK